MNADLAIDIFKTTILFALYIVSPFLLVALVVGLATSLVQSITSMQEPTLTFIPKLLAVAATLVITGPWMLKVLISYTRELFESIPTLLN